MKISLVYFSATKTTKKVLERIAQGVKPDEIEHIDLTDAENRNKTYSVRADLCIVGSPCYEARIPPIVRKALKNVVGNKTPVVAVVVYGNRTIGISLKELVGILDEQDFKVIATGTFIGEHSYANEKLKMALGRPDENDLEIAREFGQKLKEKGFNLMSLVSKDDISGKIKFLFKILPEGFLGSFATPSEIIEEACTNCKHCVNICPTKAIDENTLKINKKKCIRCMACVKFCPNDGRKILYKMKSLVKRFMRPAVVKRRKPRYMLG
ncbi:MAG: 4Fe-4S dicluster domain-containing protein [Candidatus Lokiarchaeota archaeon]|nr:4Fe-4S dicluster domain-containing protein [Candidatus Lokiarchaeota archaeon]